MHLKIHCTLKLLPLTTSVFLKGYLRPIFSLIVLNVFFVCLFGFFFFLKGYLRPIFSLIVLNVFFVCLVGFFYW